MKRLNIFFNISAIFVIFAVIVWCIAFVVLMLEQTMAWTTLLSLSILIFAALCAGGLALMLLIKLAIRN